MTLVASDVRTDKVLDRVLDGLNRAGLAKPADVAGLEFIVVVAEPATGTLSWGASCSGAAALVLLDEIIHAGAEREEEVVQ